MLSYWSWKEANGHAGEEGATWQGPAGSARSREQSLVSSQRECRALTHAAAGSGCQAPWTLGGPLLCHDSVTSERTPTCRAE